LQIIAGSKGYFRSRGFNIAEASAPVAPAVPTPMTFAVARGRKVNRSEKQEVRHVSTFYCATL